MVEEEEREGRKKVEGGNEGKERREKRIQHKMTERGKL